MVADYLDQIREIQPAGPYYLLGWSFGGLVTYSMATHLQLLGEQVGLLALLDSYPIDQELPLYIPDEQEIIKAHLEAVGYDSTSLGEEPLQFSTVKEFLLRKGHLLTDLEDRHLSAIPQIYENNIRLAASFVPMPFDGDLLLFAASQDTPESPKEDWGRYVRGHIKVHQVASSHAQMTRPLPLAEIGRAVARELEKRHNAPRPISQIKATEN
jgi:nonribosomal peptide synthetase DhbF